MTFAERIKAAWRALTFNSPVKSTAPLFFPSYRTGRPLWTLYDYASFVNEGFSLNALIYGAIMYKARALTSAPLKAYTGDMDAREEVDPNDPLALLVSRPNEHQSMIEFQQQATVYLNISGNNYTYLKRVAGDEIEAMYNLRPDRIKIVPGERDIKGYRYIPEGATWEEGMPILPKDMIHVKFTNPLDPLEGMGPGLSPISALARNGDVDNAVSYFLKNLFDRGLMQNVFIKYSVPLTDELISSAKERWREAYGGSQEGWLDPVVLGEEGEVKALGYQFDQLGFDGIDSRNETRILGPFGVPPILIGSRVGLDRATYSNYQEARQAFWEDTFVPELRLFEVDYAYHLNNPDRDVWVAFDMTEVPALKSDVVPLVNAAHQLWTMGVPALSALGAVGLNVGDIPGGDISYLPLGLVPSGRLGSEQPDQSSSAATAEEEDRDKGTLPTGKKKDV